MDATFILILSKLIFMDFCGYLTVLFAGLMMLIYYAMSTMYHAIIRLSRYSSGGWAFGGVGKIRGWRWCGLDEADRYDSLNTKAYVWRKKRLCIKRQFRSPLPMTNNALTSPPTLYLPSTPHLSFSSSPSSQSHSPPRYPTPSVPPSVSHSCWLSPATPAPSPETPDSKY